jgi:hypothetical protein
VQQAEGSWGWEVGTNTAIRLAPVFALALAACAERPDVDQIAQMDMIGLSKTDILACMGPPAQRHALGEGTEIWTYAVGYTTTDSPPWTAGLNFSLSAKPAPCDVRVVMTNAHVSQVGYGMPDGRALPSGRQCTFAVEACARRRELL